MNFLGDTLQETESKSGSGLDVDSNLDSDLEMETANDSENFLMNKSI